MTKSYGEIRLMVSYYYDSIIRNIDIETETRIAEDALNTSNADILNNIRSEFIKEINHLENLTFNKLDKLHKNNQTQLTLEDVVYPCNFIPCLFSLWKSNRYVEETILNEINEYIYNLNSIHQIELNIDHIQIQKIQIPEYEIINKIELDTYIIEKKENKKEFYRYFKTIVINCTLEIEPLIEYFDKIQNLIIQYTNISKLPDSICNLVNLIRLDVSHNELTSIPNNIRYLKNLIRLDVSYNKLTSLPDKIFNCELIS